MAAVGKITVPIIGDGSRENPYRPDTQYKHWSQISCDDEYCTIYVYDEDGGD